MPTRKFDRLILGVSGSVALVDPVSASPAPSEAPAPSLSAPAPVAAGPRALNGGSLSPSTASNFTTLLTYLQTTQRFSLFYNLTQLAPAVGRESCIVSSKCWFIAPIPEYSIILKACMPQPLLQSHIFTGLYKCTQLITI